MKTFSGIPESIQDSRILGDLRMEEYKLSLIDLGKGKLLGRDGITNELLQRLPKKEHILSFKLYKCFLNEN